MIKFTISGLKELERNLKNMEQKAKELEGENSVPFNELFNMEFMTDFTSFKTINQLFSESPFSIQTEEDFAAVDNTEWDEYIQKVTRFDTWEEMQQEAFGIWAAKQLGF